MAQSLHDKNAMLLNSRDRDGSVPNTSSNGSPIVSLQIEGSP